MKLIEIISSSYCICIEIALIINMIVSAKILSKTNTAKEIMICLILENIGIVLGNLLDNALEAARKSADKWVNAAIWRERDLLILTVENSLAVLPRQNGSLFFTSKPDKRHHGIGLRNVERVVRKYDGRLKFQVNPKHFRVEAILNVKRR